MLSLLLFRSMYILMQSLSGVDARAVNTTVASHPISAVSSFIISDLTNGTASVKRCNDIDNCRTLDDIIQSCLVTILACVWFAVHRNIPAPRPKPSKDRNIFFRTAHRAWYLVLDQRESAIVFVIALLAPEWILAWALRQALRAWRLAQKLEEARLEAIKGRHSAVSDSQRSAGVITESAERDSSVEGSAALHEDSHLRRRHPNPDKTVAICERCAARGSQCDIFAAAQSVAKAGWGMSHAFFVIMGGFHFYNKHGPLHPLSPNNVLGLVARGHLVPPTAEEISNQSKGDALSKGIAVIQTLWFVIQCIVRHIEDLPVTSLEVMTIAYTIITVTMYMAWWDKPLNVICAVRVPEPEEKIEGEVVQDYKSISDRVFAYFMGWQDGYVDLRECKGVPTFWAGRPEVAFVFADIIALLVAMVFGAVHCIAWHSEFPTRLELQLWRASAITIIAAPVAPAVVLGGAVLTGSDFGISVLYTLIAIVYVAARLILIVLSFTSLRGLPVAAYRTVQWTTFIPHF